MSYKEIWQKLSAIDCTPYIEKKNQMVYLSWAGAWGLLMEHYPEATYEFSEPESYPDGTMMVFCTVSIGECSRKAWLPVMDHKNKPISNPDAFARNTSLMRVLVKCLAFFGLGSYIYIGDDLPKAELERLYSPISQEQHSELTVMISQLNGDIDMPAFLKFFGISALLNLKQSDFHKAKLAISKKLDAKVAK